MDVGEAGGAEPETPAATGGSRVARTGIALVHEGEYIMPAPGSAAAVAPDVGTEVTYHFPVEIHAVGALPDSERAELAGRVFDQLGWELAGRV